MKVYKRNGSVEEFQIMKIKKVIEKVIKEAGNSISEQKIQDVLMDIQAMANCTSEGFPVADIHNIVTYSLIKNGLMKYADLYNSYSESYYKKQE